MSKKIEYEKKLQTQLDEFSVEIEKLKIQADKSEPGAEPRPQVQIEVLQKQHEQARKKLDELRASSEDAWEDLKDGIASAWDSVSVALKSATGRF